MELLQISTDFCQPCKYAKEYILNTYDINFINYTYISLDSLNDATDTHVNIVRKIRPKRVPLFVVTDKDEIIYTFTGFDKVEIDRYADYIRREKSVRVRRSESIVDIMKKEQREREDEQLKESYRVLKNIFEKDEDDEDSSDLGPDLNNLNNPNLNRLNGQGHIYTPGEDQSDEDDEDEDYEDDDPLV